MNCAEAIDWQLSIKLANNKPDLAAEMLDMYVQDLPNVKATLQELLHKEDYAELQAQIHRLRSASCYCGVPKISQQTSKLEQLLSQHKAKDISILINELDDSIDEVVSAHKSGHYR